MQRRVGPYFVGYKGRLQYIADALKLFIITAPLGILPYYCSIPIVRQIEVPLPRWCCKGVRDIDS